MAAMTEDEMKSNIATELRKAGMPAEYIYAFQKTGMLRNPLNEAGWSDAERAEWDAAIAEYRAK